MPPLDGCRAKIARAELHLGELRDRTRDYLQTQPYRIEGEYEAATREYVIRAHKIPNYAPVPSDLILIAGEVAHQLRSAMDHVVWDLVVENTQAPPPGTDSGFPIFREQAGYQARAPKRYVACRRRRQT